MPLPVQSLIDTSVQFVQPVNENLSLDVQQSKVQFDAQDSFEQIIFSKFHANVDMNSFHLGVPVSYIIQYDF